MVLLTIVSMDNYYKPKVFDINTMEFKNFVKTLESTKTDDEKEEQPFSSVNTSTETPFLPCNRCCEKIRIRSSDLAAELHPHLLGIYSQVIDATIDCSHPPIYK